MRGRVAAVALLLATAASARGAGRIVLEEILGSWQGDATVQFVELRMIDVGQQDVAGAELAIDDATGDVARRRFFTFPRDVTVGVTDARILVATQGLARIAGVTPDFVLPDGLLAARDGRVCYQIRDAFGAAQTVDCVAYGAYEGDNAPWGRPTLTPDNRSLQRVALEGVNRVDWRTTLGPTPQNNAGAGQQLETLCGDERVSQGEECDGRELGGRSCADLGFAKGKLRCTQCHLDATKCTACGDGDIDDGEQCDGAEVGERTCQTLGFTGGVLGCSDRCQLSTATCEATFFVPGGGPPAHDCLGEWRTTNAGARPAGNGKAPPRLRCRDGDSGCDTDTVAGTCTVLLSICVAHADARLAQCRAGAIDSWTLLRPTPAQDAVLATQLVSAVAALGPSTTTEGAVAFTPPLAEAACSAPQSVMIRRRAGGAGTLVLRARVTAGGRRDPDTLRLSCVP